MNLRLSLSILACKALSFVAQRLGGGTDRPGKIALKLYPKALAQLRYKGKIIAVTGSNGKTTTSNLIAHCLRQQGYQVLNNAKGSNLVSGVATTLLGGATLGGLVKADYVVLEVDECYSRFVFEDVPVDQYLVLNLLRDQVVRNGNPDLVFDKVLAAVKKRPNCGLILNAYEPISYRLSKAGNPVVTFAMERSSRSTDHCVSGTHDCKICPQCFHKMDYDFYHYNHLGRFHCSHCDYASPEPDFMGRDLDFDSQTMCVNGQPLQLTYNTTFNFYNTVAAAAVCCTVGAMNLAQFAQGAASFQVPKERLDTFQFEGRKVVCMLTKQNAASLDQSLSYVLEQPGEKTVAIYINNVLYLDYKDISWLYDVAFERLQGQVANILCSGNRALDAAVRVKAAGFDEPVLVYENDLDKVKEAFRRTKGDIYILSTSAFGDEGKILEVLKA